MSTRMMTRQVSLSFAAFLAIHAGAATWVGTTGSFTNEVNWDTGLVPGVGQPAVVANGGTAQFDGGAATNLASVGLGTGSAAAVGTLDMSAGELSSTTFTVGGNGGVGTLNISGGAVAVSGGAGAFSVAPASGSTGTVTMTGGTLTTAGELWIGPAAGGHAYFNLNGGTVVCKNWGVVGRNSTDARLFMNGGSWSNIVANNFTIGSTGEGFVDLTDGTLYSQFGIYVSEYGPGTLSVLGGAVSASWMEVARDVTGSLGALLVDGGALWLNELRTGRASDATLRFSGGSLGARDGNATWRSDVLLSNTPGSGTVTLYAGDQNGAARVNTYSGLLSGNGAVAVDAAPGQTAPGTVILGANNTFTGGATLNGANTLQLGAGGTSGWILDPLTIAGGGDLAFNRADTITNSLAISGAGDTVIQNGTGMLVLTNAAPTFSSAAANAGSILFAETGAIPGAGASVTLNGGAVAAAGAYATVTDWLDSGRISAASAGGIALTADSGEAIDMTTAGGGLYTNLTLGAVGAVTYSGTLTPIGGTYRLGGGGGSLTFATPIASGTVLMNGAGNVSLAAGNTFTDGVHVTRGTLTALHPDALGTGPVLVSGGVLQISTGVVASAGILVTNAGMLQVSPGGTIDGSVVNQAVSAGAGTTAGFVFNGGATFTHTDDVMGSGELAVLGGGSLLLNTPGQTVSQGELWVGNNGSPGNLELSDGTLNVSNWLLVARGTVSGTPSSTLTLSGGTLNKVGTGGTTIIGDINGSVGAMILTNSAVFNAAGGNVLVGTGTGTGKLIVHGGMLNRTAADLIAASGGASAGTITMYGGTVSNNAGWVYIGYSSGGRGTLAVTNGLFYCLNNLRVGEQAGSSGYLQLAGGNVAVGTLYLGESGYGHAVQTGGTLARSMAAAGEWRMGDAAAGVGVYDLIDGTLDTGGANFQIGATGRGTLSQSGGTFTCGQWPVVGRFTRGVGVYELSGGTFNQTGAGNRLIVGESGTGTFTVRGTGVANLAGGLSIGHVAGGTGTVNLVTGGVIVTPTVYRNHNAASVATFNFDGGTLRASACGGLMQNLSAANVKAGGAVIDTGTNRVVVAQDLNSAAGQDGGVTKLGTGLLTLGGTNGCAGSVRVESGTLRAPKRTLSHRWSFNNSLADSVGGSTATAFGSVTPGATEYTLAGGARGTSYISLGQYLLPNVSAPVTIELWATQKAIQNWSRIFDFGSSTANYLMMSWTRATAQAQDRVDIIPGGGVSDSMQPYTLNQQYHISMVITPGAGTGGSTLFQWYKMDATGATLRSGSISLPWTLATLNQVNMWLGHSQFNDSDASASYNEVRFWNGALSQGQLAANSLLGPDTLPALDGALPADATVTVASGAALDMDGGSLAVADLAGTGLLTNGTLSVSGAIAPGGTHALGSLSVASATLAGTLLVDVTAAGDCDLLQAAGGLSLSGLSLQVQDLGQLSRGEIYVIATCAPGGLAGTFASTNLTVGRWGVIYDNHRGEVRLFHKRGAQVIIQ